MRVPRVIPTGQCHEKPPSAGRDCGRTIFADNVSVGSCAFQPAAGSPDWPRPSKSAEVRLPNGKLQQDEILKADHEKSVKDAAQLIELSENLKKELEKDDSHVLSISSLKKTEEIEKIAKRIRARLKH
jgi:hypothetical protein